MQGTMHLVYKDLLGGDHYTTYLTVGCVYDVAEYLPRLKYKRATQNCLPSQHAFGARERAVPSIVAIIIRIESIASSRRSKHQCYAPRT